MAQRRPPDDPDGYYENNEALMRDNRSSESDRKGSPRGRPRAESPPRMRDEDIEKLFDIPEKFTIPDTSGEVDPHRRCDETDISSHRSFDPSSANPKKKKKHRKKKSPHQRGSGAMTDTSAEGDYGGPMLDPDDPTMDDMDRGPPIPPHGQGMQDIFADERMREQSPDKEVMFTEGGPSEPRENEYSNVPAPPKGPSREDGRQKVQRHGQQHYTPDPEPLLDHSNMSDPTKAPFRSDLTHTHAANSYNPTAHRRPTGGKRSRRYRRSRIGTGNFQAKSPCGKFDRTPHEVFVELHELDAEEMQWNEKARWIKFEENVEEATGQWGKPHVANLSFLQLIELRKYLETGSVLLDIEDKDISSIFHRIVDNLVVTEQVHEEDRGEILRSLFYDHWHVEEQRGLVSGLMNIRNRSNTRSTFKRPNQRSPQRGGYNDDLSNSQGLSPKEQQDLKRLKHNQNQPGMAVSFANGNGHSDVKIPIVQNEANEDETGFKKKGKKGKEKTSVGGRRMTLEGQAQNKNDILKKIPQDAEGVTVLVGEMDCLDIPVLSFVRLSEGTQLEGLTEIPIPVRFLFVLLGPGGGEVDYYEIGRCFSTLMSSENFNEAAYLADGMKDILTAMNKFIGETMVLPAGNWNKELLMPVLRKQKQLRKEAGYDDTESEDEENELLADGKKSSKKPAALINPLERVRRPFGGMWNDIKRRYPFYLSDFKDAINGQCLAAVVFIFFAALSPAITFGGLLGEKTENWMGISEMIVGTSVCGVIFALFSGQPLVIIGVTGPILVFEENLYSFCKSMDIEYLPFRFWTGLWLCIVAMICCAAEGSVLVRYISRFTEEIFSFLISLIFIYEVFNKLAQIYFQHPLHTTEWYCAALNSTSVGEVQATLGPPTMGFGGGGGITSNPFFSTAAPVTNGTVCAAKEPPKSDQPNTALLSTILMFGTYLLANQLKVFKNSHYLGKSARKLLADFGIPIAIMVMVGKDLAITTVYTTKLDVPNGLVPTDGCKRGWFVNPMGTEKPFPIMWMAAAIVPALLAFILMFMEVLITELIVNKKDNKLKKGGGFHLDLFLLGLLAAFNGLFGLPWVWSATVRSVTHLGALTVFSTTHAPGEKPRLEMIREQRVTGLLVSLFIGLSIALAPVLKRVPLAVLFGVFLFMGVSSLNGVQFADRVFMLAMPRKHHPDIKAVRNVRQWRMHMYTIIQLGGVAMLWGVKISPAALAFPFFLILLVPIRKVLERIFTAKELDALDAADAKEDELEVAQEVVVPT